MSESALVEPRVGAHSPPERIAFEVGVVTRRLLDVLKSLPASDRELAGACAFLQSLADASPRVLPRNRWTPAHPLDRIAGVFGFEQLDTQLLLLAGLPDEHEGLASVLASVHPANEPRATGGLAAQLFAPSQASRRVLREHLETGAAVRSGAIRLTGSGPLFNRSLEIAPALWSALNGIDVWPDTIVLEAAPITSAGLEHWLGTREAMRAAQAIRRRAQCTILMRGADMGALLQRGAILAAHAQTDSVRLVLRDHDPAAKRHALLHAAARGATPILAISADSHDGTDLYAGLNDFPGTFVVCVPDGVRFTTAGRPLIEVPVERISPSHRVHMWRSLLPELEDAAELLSMTYNTEPSATGALVTDARAFAGLEDRAVRVEDVVASVRARTAGSSASGLALRRATAGWSELVLAPDRLAQLHEAIERLRHQPRVLGEWRFLSGRGGARGVRLLFAGPPGTGKTLAAEVLANALGVDLLIVDLSKVVSKWLGETEKHLADIFDAAERSQAVLLFDEADALFGRRTDVSDAHDRYANLETAYLLTRLERFEGLAVLSTNLQRQLDPAFMRRLEFVVDFDEPGVRERAQLWRCHLPAAAPLAADLDVNELASLYPVVGGLIRNASVAAAFQAASANTPITRALIVRAIRREYQKSGRAFPGLPPGMAEL